MPQPPKTQNTAPRNHRDVFTVRERENARPFWLKIGRAFVNRDGSETIVFDALPIGERVVIRASEKPSGGDGDQDQG